jgi:hypothetical protein
MIYSIQLIVGSVDDRMKERIKIKMALGTNYRFELTIDDLS